MPTIPPMPKLPLGYLGPQRKFKAMKLDVFSHTNSIIRLFNGNEVTIKIGYTYPTLMDFRLENVDTKKDSSRYVYKEVDDENQVVKFHITLPKKGSYTFEISALPENEELGVDLEKVYNYLLLCQRISKKAKCHPKQSKECSAGFKLRRPEGIGRELAGTKVPFSLKIPGAFNVAVVVGQEWTELTRMSDTSDEWSGEAFLDKRYFGYGENVSISVRFQEDCPAYSPILVYTI